MKDANTKGTKQDMRLNLSTVHGQFHPGNQVISARKRGLTHPELGTRSDLSARSREEPSTPRTPIGPTPLSARPRSRSMAQVVEQSEQNPEIRDTLLEARLMVMIDSLSAQSIKQSVKWSEEQLALIIRACQDLRLGQAEKLHLIFKHRPLTPASYQDLFRVLWGHWLQIQQPAADLQAEVEDMFEQGFAGLRQATLAMPVEMPDFSKINPKHKRGKQTQLEIFWYLCQSTLAPKIFKQTILALSHQSDPILLFHRLNQLLPLMNAPQLALVQWVGYYISLQHPQIINDSQQSASSVRHFWATLRQQRKLLESCDAYLVTRITLCLEQIKANQQHPFLLNLYFLQAWCNQALAGVGFRSFTRLLEQGMAWKYQDEKRTLAHEVAAEMMRSVTSFYQKMPLTEFMIKNATDRSILGGEFTVYFNAMIRILTNSLKALQEDVHFSKALAFFLEVARQLSDSSRESAFADLTSLMIITMVLADLDICKRAENLNLMMSEGDKRLLQELVSTYTPWKNYVGVRELMSKFSLCLPCLPVMTKDLEFAFEGNADLRNRYEVLGSLMARMQPLMQRLNGEFIFFTTNIRSEITADPSFLTAKAKPVIIEVHPPYDLGEILKELTQSIDKGLKPELRAANHPIPTEGIRDFLLDIYTRSISPTDTFLRRQQALINDLFAVTERIQRLLQIPEPEEPPATSSNKRLSRRFSFLSSRNWQDSIQDRSESARGPGSATLQV